MINHIWFDMGGTLYRETAAFDKVHDALRYKTYAAIVGESDLDLAEQEFKKLYAQYGSNSAVFTSLGKPSDFWQRTFENIDLSSVLEPDKTVNETLQKLNKTVPISLFTNFKASKIADVCKLLEIDENLFRNIISGDDIQKRKPDLEGFQKMIELSELPSEQILYVGDRVDVDIVPAQTLGIQACLMYGESSTPDYSLDDFADLLSLVS